MTIYPLKIGLCLTSSDFWVSPFFTDDIPYLYTLDPHALVMVLTGFSFYVQKLLAVGPMALSPGQHA